MAEMLELELRQVAAALEDKQLSPVELTKAGLARIAEQQPRINAFVCLTEERALAAARKAESEIQAGRWRGELHGVPIAVKDLYDTVAWSKRVPGL
jgi:Asp-tRNA(Asn)/Glu-tRNA(Gln) amidotransferase A subunit family amidase